MRNRDSHRPVGAEFREKLHIQSASGLFGENLEGYCDVAALGKDASCGDVIVWIAIFQSEDFSRAGRARLLPSRRTFTPALSRSSGRGGKSLALPVDVRC